MVDDFLFDLASVTLHSLSPASRSQNKQLIRTVVRCVGEKLSSRIINREEPRRRDCLSCKRYEALMPVMLLRYLLTIILDTASLSFSSSLFFFSPFSPSPRNYLLFNHVLRQFRRKVSDDNHILRVQTSFYLSIKSSERHPVKGKRCPSDAEIADDCVTMTVRRNLAIRRHVSASVAIHLSPIRATMKYPSLSFTIEPIDRSAPCQVKN